MDDKFSYISTFNRVIDEHIMSIREFMSNDQISDIGKEYRESKCNQPEYSINVFEMVSDKYKKENFHSDIIRAFLDPKENHNEGFSFLYTFIDFINNNQFKVKGKDVYISKQNYQTVNVEREEGRIDILIKSDRSKHCIIIENKINNAPDTERQLPKYFVKMTETGYTVDAIVYLPLDPNKEPNQFNWSDTDKLNVLPKLCIIPAYQKQGLNLVTGWIEPCTLKARNLICVSILKQYGELIKKRQNNIMDNIILSKFYQSLMTDKKNLESAISIKNMLGELPIYMADRLCEKFNIQQADYKVWKWKPNFCGILFSVNNLQYKIDVWTSENPDDTYGVYVFEQNQYDKQLNWAKGMDSLVKFGFELYCEGNDCFKYKKTGFSFYDEDKVIQCVNALIDDFRKVIQEENQ